MNIPIRVDLSILERKETKEKETKEKEPKKETKEKKEKKVPKVLKCRFHEENHFEIGIDEAGRGPLFGRLYVAAVVLPTNIGVEWNEIKDSKTFTSKIKIRKVYDFIKQNALVYHIHFIEANIIDKINIRQSVLQAMRECAKEVMDRLPKEIHQGYKNEHFLLVDGNDFMPLTRFDEKTNTLYTIPYQTFVKGDGDYMAIAAASILAKVARDDYILELCKEYPLLAERYGMDKHMGYGTKQHLEAIKTHGITQFHRKTYGCCKTVDTYLI